jgi:hypothetical protein
VPWLKLHTDTMDDPKLRDVSAEARWLWICGRCYIAERLSDGVITRAVFRTAGLRRPAEAAMTLLNAQLWERRGNDFFDPGWQDSSPSRSHVQAQRKKLADRVAAWRQAHDSARSQRPGRTEGAD